MKLALLVLLVSITVLSCGVSDKEKADIIASQKSADDSLRLSELNSQKKLEAEKTAFQDSLTDYGNLLNQQKTALVNLRATIYSANDQMNQIKAFHLGRLPSDRDAQIHNQEVYIQTLLLRQDSLSAAIRSTNNRIIETNAALAKTK